MDRQRVNKKVKSMAGRKENLKKPRSTEEARRWGKKGGIASGKARREKADLKKQLQVFLESNATIDKNGNPLTGAELMVKVAVKEMTKGNPKYWELIRDTAGFKPVDKVVMAEVDQDIIDEVEDMVLRKGKKNAKNNEA